MGSNIPPAEARALLDALGPEIDVVYGAPKEETHGLWRDLASRLTKWALQAIMGVEVARNVSAFRALRTEVREGFARFDGSYVHMEAMLTWVTNRFAAVRVKHEPRRFGRSNYAFRDLVRVAIELATGFSERAVTQGGRNVKAQRLYQKCGLPTRSVPLSGLRQRQEASLDDADSSGRELVPTNGGRYLCALGTGMSSAR